MDGPPATGLGLRATDTSRHGASPSRPSPPLDQPSPPSKLDDRIQALELGGKLSTPKVGQRVEAPTWTARGRLIRGRGNFLDPALTHEPIHRLIERSGPQDDFARGALTDCLPDPVPVRGSVDEGEQHLQGASGHRLASFR